MNRRNKAFALLLAVGLCVGSIWCLHDSTLPAKDIFPGVGTLILLAYLIFLALRYASPVLTWGLGALLALCLASGDILFVSQYATPEARSSYLADTLLFLGLCIAFGAFVAGLVREKRTRPISGVFCLGWASGGFGANWAFAALRCHYYRSEDWLLYRDSAELCIVASVVLTVLSMTAMLWLLYKAWASIQDGQVALSPGKAVGYLFVPILSYYWLFRALWGFSMEYNRYVKRHALDLPNLPQWLFLGYATMLLVAGIANIAFRQELSDLSTDLSAVTLLMVPFFLVQAGVVRVTCRAVNTLS